MRLSGTIGLFLIASSAIVACSGSGSAVVDPNTFSTIAQSSGGAAQNNTQAQGGNATIGGSSNAVGGIGPSQTGGANAAGGVNSNGGNQSQGGNPTTGGKAGAGGAVATGGKLGTGGVVATTGGNGSPTGGAGVSTGGVGASTGGVGVSTGGVGMLTGGSSAVSNCTDTPRSSETCAQAKQYGFCGQSWFTNCEVTCGTCGSGSAGGAGSTGGAAGSTGGAAGSTGGAAGSTGGVNGNGGDAPTGGSGAVSNTTNPQISGTDGFATRYWDCCMPSCSWKTNLPYCDADGMTKHTGTSNGVQSGCSGGNAFECYDFSPWYDSSTNMSYGFVAFNSGNCGDCYELQFSGSSNGGAAAGATAIKGRQMMVQVINIGSIGANQFDLLIPGGGVGQMTSGCPKEWGSSADLGSTNGGLFAEVGDCSKMKAKCQSVWGSVSNGSTLIAGCDWFVDWFECADNPNLVYKSVSCPSQLKSKSGIGN